MEILWDFYINSIEILLEFFGISLGSFLNMEEIDLFVKILIFVKILSKWRRKKNFEFLEVRLQVHRT